MHTIKIDLMDVVLSFTMAMDSVNSELKNHHTRVSNIAMNIVSKMNLPDEEVFNILIASLLHDIGATSIVERSMMTTLDFDSNYTHAETGYRILKDFCRLKKAACIIRHHHRHWNYGKNGRDENGNEIPVGSWVIHLADRIDIAMNHRENPLIQKEPVVEKLRKHFGKIFHPDAVEAFMSLADKEFFWLDVNASDPTAKYGSLLEKQAVTLTGSTVEDLGRSFSQIIDFRNKFTSTHSAGVSASAEALTRVAGFDNTKQSHMRIAGFLHDLGKIVIPIPILQKDGPLTMEERLIINSHTYHTYNILSHVKGLEEINGWASYHHEKLDGSGYPFHLTAPDLCPLSRVMMFADIFTALREDRPYRPGMEKTQVEKIITEQVKAGKLDGDIWELMIGHYEEIDEERAASQYQVMERYVNAIKMDEAI